MENPQERIDKLVRLVKYYDYMLHIKGKTLISDEIYDSMRKELENLEAIYPEFLREDSPSQYIGTVSEACNRIIHRKIPMLSLRHTYDKSELIKFINDSLKIDNKLIFEPKIDGVAVSIVYIDGILDSISLRGDGKKGEDITHFAPYINNLILEIDETEDIEIRGEIIASKHVIKDNNRNYVAGCLRRKNAENFNLKFMPYKIIYNNIKTQEDSMKFLEKYMEIPKYIIFDNTNYINEDIFGVIDDILNTDFEYFIDGVVIKINNLEIGNNLGITNRYPRDAMAYKISTKSENTEIIDILWNMNRKGVLVPVCILQPIIIDGSNIGKVHGYNKRYIKDNHIGIGTKVNISRVGDVIPQISNILESTKFKSIDNCPFCKSEILEDEINYICTNDVCQERNLQNILYFFNKLKIEGISYKIINKFLNTGIVSILDILHAINSKDWIEDKNDLNAYNKWLSRKNSITLKDVLISLGIPGVSDGYINELDLDIDNLLNDKEVSGKKSQAFIQYICENIDLIKNIWKIIKT